MIEFTPTYIPLNAEVRPRFTAAGERWARETFTGPHDQWAPFGDLLDMMVRLNEQYAPAILEGVEVRPVMPSHPLTGAEMAQIHTLKVEEVVEELNRRISLQREERNGVLRIDLHNLPYGELVGTDALQRFRVAGWDVTSGAGSREMLFDPPDEVVGPPAPTSAEKELDDAWRAAKSGARGLTTLADVIANMREQVEGAEKLRADLKDLTLRCRGFSPGDVQDAKAWVEKVIVDLWSMTKEAE